MGSMSAFNTGREILVEEVERADAFHKKISSANASDAVLPTSKTERSGESARL
jgi:hypothetical protein